MVRAAFGLQRILLVVSYAIGRLLLRGTRRRTVSWIIGPRETAGVVHAMAARVPGSLSVVLVPNRFYSHPYDIAWASLGRWRDAFRSIVVSPVLLGWLANRARGIVYVGSYGFLMDQFDARRFEFRFLKRRGVRIGCYWCGSDIRSTKLMHELESEMGLPNISTYIESVSPWLGTQRHDDVVRARAAVADEFADIMFSFPTAQRSYLTRWTEPAYYFTEDERFLPNREKFDAGSPLVVAHSASSPIIKGTQLVRAAVAELKANGYDFEYLELIDVPNESVLAGLHRAHIVLNHFYGFTTGMFALEAMAANCAVVSSTDETIERMLPPGANNAVRVTKFGQLADHLADLLDNPQLIEPLARRGYDWTYRYTSTAQAGHLLNALLDSVLDGAYDPVARSALPVATLWGDVVVD